VDARAGGDPTAVAVAATDDDYDDNDDDDDDDDDEGGRGGSDKTAPNGNRLVGGAELVLQTSTDRIWLSILRKVYDVTDGEDFNGALGGWVQVLRWEGCQSVLRDRQEHPGWSRGEIGGM
jgi:hypothetical protein